MSIYTLINSSPLPATRFAWQLDEVKQLRERMLTQTELRDGVLFWNTNGAPVPVSCFEEAGVPVSAEQVAAVRLHTDRVVADYRRSARRLSEDNLAEARNELGLGAFDIITRRRLR